MTWSGMWSVLSRMPQEPNALSVQSKYWGSVERRTVCLSDYHSCVWCVCVCVCVLTCRTNFAYIYNRYSILFSRFSSRRSSPRSKRGRCCRLTEEKTALTASFLGVNTPQTIYTHSHTTPPLLRVNIPLPLTCRSGSRTHTHTHTPLVSVFRV